MALSLGECRLRNLREAKGLSQLALSEALMQRYGLSISDTSISAYERGKKKLNPLVSRAICLTLGCVEADLYVFVEA
ncbi:helix-turn-helix domain-containing protein [Paenibacillus wynnii]|uniref:helix-turn-helix domain-containing protein n=1 Tax=Paenibacillus wynnii TaxID=268407 RepID=UPI00056A002A|nr:helix-turn-helix transcriptional regulator [Paenibacillus wynnii]